MQINPFERIRFRSLAGSAILTFIATVFCDLILGAIFPEWFKGKSSPLGGPLILLLLYVFFPLFTFRLLSRAGLSYSRLCGPFPAWRTLGLWCLWAIPLVIFSISTVFFLYYPVSHFVPEFFKERLIEGGATEFMPGGDKHVFANLLNTFMVILLAPVLEEFFFRGILLTRWTVKWGIAKSIFASSTVFAFLHSEPLSAFCFGCVMAIIYIRTKSLFIPMAIHIANNSIPTVISWLEIPFGDSASQTTIEEYQELWPIGLAGFALITPFAIYFWKHYVRNTHWEIPYFSESDVRRDV